MSGLEVFRDNIKEIQRRQYFEIEWWFGNEELIIDFKDYFSVITRSVEFKHNRIEWRLLQESSKRFFSFLKTIEEKIESNKNLNKFKLYYLDTKGNRVGGFEFIGITLEDLDLSEAGVNQEGGAVNYVTLRLGVKTNRFIEVDE